MRKDTWLLTAFWVAILALMLAIAPAQAQATRTWVSGVGDDINPCSRTAPCKTFAGAISKTAAGGEISVMDPGGFGAVTITKAITISGDGTAASVLNAGTNGIVVSAGAADRVVLRNLSIDGAGSGLNGIRFLAGAQLVVDHCTIYAQTGAGIDVNVAANAQLLVTNSYIGQVFNAITVVTSAGTVSASLNNVTIFGVSDSAVVVNSPNAFAQISNSLISAVGANAVVTNGANAQASVDGSTLTNAATALNTQGAGSVIRISNSNIYNNATGFTIADGSTIETDNSNRTGSNGGTTVPNGMIVHQ
jgi:hypothetical protein